MLNRILTAVSGGVLLAGAWGCGGSASAEAPPTFTTAPVMRTDLRIAAEATGQVEPIRTIEVKSKASGEVLKLFVDTGDRIEPGDLMAELDPRDVRNAHNQAVADLDVAQARVEIAEAQRKRSEELLAAEVITTQEHEGKNLEYANARASLVKAQTNLELARLRLGDVTIRAPLQGTVIEKNVEEGQVIQSASQNVSGGTTLFKMANLDRMQVRTLVDETDVGQLAAGMESTVRVEAFPDRSFVGSIDKIEPQAVVEQNVTMFPVIVSLDNRSGLLKPGMNAEVEVEVAERPNVLTVPNSAVVEPQQFAAAAQVLGLNPDALDFDLRTAFGGFRGGRGARGEGPEGAARQAGQGPAGEPGQAGAQRRPGGESQPDGAGLAARQAAGQDAPGAAAGAAFGGDSASRARMAEIRAKVQSGEITRDSARAIFMAAGGRPGGRAGGQGGEDQAAPGAGQQDGRPAVAFVRTADGSFVPRAVRLGLSDWDQTEVTSGLEEGEEVALIGAAQLQAQQQEFLNRIRSRTGGSPFGGGGRR